MKQKDVIQTILREKKNHKFQKDADGRTIVRMTVKNDDDFLSEFSHGETPMISSSVADFIENSTFSLSPTEDLTLKIHSDCIKEDEQALYTAAVKEYYLHRYLANEKKLKRNLFLVLLLGLAGVFVLFLMLLLNDNLKSEIWTEVIDIIAWVLLWEAADIALLETRELREEKRRYLAYLDMKIEYDSIQKPPKRTA